MATFVYRFDAGSILVSSPRDVNGRDRGESGGFVMLTDGSVHMIPDPCGAWPAVKAVCTASCGILDRKLVRGDSIASTGRDPRHDSRLGPSATGFRDRALKKFPLDPDPTPPGMFNHPDDESLVLYLHEIHYAEYITFSYACPFTVTVCAPAQQCPNQRGAGRGRGPPCSKTPCPQSCLTATRG